MVLHASASLALTVFLAAAMGTTDDPLARAQRLLSEERFEEAMDLLERVARDRAREALQQRLLGQAYLGFGLQRLAEGGSDVGLYFSDAERRLEQAERSGDDSFELHRDRARALYQLSRFEEAVGPSRRAVASLPASASAIEAAAVYAQHAQILDRVLDARGTYAVPEGLELRAAAASACTLRPDDVETRRFYSRTLFWTGDTRRALEVLTPLVLAAPERADLWEQWRNTGLLATRSRDWLEERADELATRIGTPLARWHQALTELKIAEFDHRGRRYTAAKRAYERSAELFEQVQDAAEDYNDSSTFYRAQALSGVGWCEYFVEHRHEAETWFLQSIETRPDHARTADALGLTPVRAIEAIASRYVDDSYRTRNLERLAGLQLRARTLLERATAFVPDHAAWRNNLGFLYREAGTRAEEASKPNLAMELYETSYAHYRRAVELAPRDARVVNDCALMLVYHLQRNLDRAEPQLEESVHLAREGVAAFDRGEDPGVGRTRDELLEAGGDALQNLGYLYLVHKQDKVRARSYFQAVLSFDPVRPRNSQVRQYLEQIEKNQ
ncbi:MAG: tetratricopeptide repeat protein [Planctomycetes bacterium]|nr:tetratricopeptide repeat protein [Planctomycetota bacterium]